MTAQNTSEKQSKLANRTVKDVYPVSRLVREVRVLLEGSFPLLWVEGEISNLAMPASGHIYFTLKDEAAQVRCAMFRNRNQQLRFTPENGMQVLLRVRVTMYEGRGEFQLVVEHMEEAGSGALQRAYEALKHRLGQEGLFDDARKQALPSMPKTIGIVSSPDGAAVHDILSVLKRRFSAVDVILYPVAVQGESAARQIAEAIQLADQRKECDVLIVGRGGGSLEDLWSFNDENLARVMVGCELPIISAVGHEIDFTIADFVADVRAPTPSAAAEIAVPDSRHILQNVVSLKQRLGMRMLQTIANQQRHIDHLQRRLPRPNAVLAQQQRWLQQQKRRLDLAWSRALHQRQQQLDYLAVRLKHPQAKIDLHNNKLATLNKRLQQLIHHQQQQQRQLLENLQSRLRRQLPVEQIKQNQHQLISVQKQLHRSMSSQLDAAKLGLSQQIRTLAAVSPLSTLERGYSITSVEATGRVITDATEVELGQSVQIRLHKGQLQCEVKHVSDN